MTTKKTKQSTKENLPETDKKKSIKKSVEKKPSSKTATTMDELLKGYSSYTPKKGDQIDAEIIALDRRQMLFDIGWKSYAVLGDQETRELTTYLPYFKKGDKVQVKIVVEEAKDGYPVVSMRKFFEKGKWDILIEKQQNEEEIEVTCAEYGRGGVFVDFMGIRGVIPKIQLAEQYINEPDKLYGQKIKVKLLEVDKAKNRLVVSQKAAVLGISYRQIRKEFDEIKIGEKRQAKVIGFSDFGVFCEVGGIEGLIHISEISWAKVVDPSVHLKVGDTIDVVVVEKNDDNFKLNLSIKRLSQDPWVDVEKKYPVEKQIEASIMRRERYGYIVRLEDGIEGLIHISKIEGMEDLEIGKKINVYIEKIDTKNRRISLILVPKEKPVVYR